MMVKIHDNRYGETNQVRVIIVMGRVIDSDESYQRR
jgi:hypothetical protein